MDQLETHRDTGWVPSTGRGQTWVLRSDPLTHFQSPHAPRPTAKNVARPPCLFSSPALDRCDNRLLARMDRSELAAPSERGSAGSRRRRAESSIVGFGV